MNKSQSNYSGWKKLDRKEYSTHNKILFTLNSKKCKQIYNNRKQTNGSLGTEGQDSGTEGHKKTLGSNGYVHYVNCSGGFTSVCIC